MLPRPQGKPSTQWQFIGRERRNRNDDDDVDLYRRVPPR
jgi:hypothetical protein